MTHDKSDLERAREATATLAMVSSWIHPTLSNDESVRRFGEQLFLAGRASRALEIEEAERRGAMDFRRFIAQRLSIFIEECYWAEWEKNV